MIRLGHILSAGCLIVAGCMPSGDGDDSGSMAGGQAAVPATGGGMAPGAMNSGGGNVPGDASNGGGETTAMMPAGPGNGMAGGSMAAPGDGEGDFDVPASLKQPFEGADPEMIRAFQHHAE